jgi:hypothetical protein
MPIWTKPLARRTLARVPKSGDFFTLSSWLLGHNRRRCAAPDLLSHAAANWPKAIKRRNAY